MKIKSCMIMFMMVVLVTVASVSLADEEGLGSERLQHIFTAALNLSDAQVTQLRSAFDGLNQALERIINTSKDEGLAGLLSLRDDIDGFVTEAAPLFDDFLTDDQRKLLRDSEQLEKALFEVVKDEVSDALADEFLGDLNLQKAQRAGIRSILKADIEKRQALIDKYQGKKGVKALRSFRDDSKAVREDTERQLEEVLSDEQLKTFRDLQDKLLEELIKKLFKR